MSKKGRLEGLGRILHYEIDAANVYDRLLRASPLDLNTWDFERISQDHKHAIGSLKREIAELGGDPTARPRPRDVWPLAQKSKTLKLWEDQPTILALKAGEEHLIAEMHKVLANGNLRPEARNFLQAHLLPTLTDHVLTLNQFLYHEEKVEAGS